MRPAAIARTGEPVIDEWTVHCPDCGQAVSVPPGAEAVACPHCKGAFAPQALATAALRRPGPPPSSDSWVGQTLGGWRLLRLLGRGGMGRVYEATDAKGRRRVAVKLLSEDLTNDPAFVKRFHREARLLASLSHPHVVEVYEQGEERGHLYFVMEYVRGENLRRRLERGPLAPAEAVRIGAEIASALGYAHEHGIVHRDLKPENVLLDEQGNVHLADFGLSRLAHQGRLEETTLLTRTDVILGTYEYMSPEQRRGAKDLDGRADLFALGVILYEMLTGRLPVGRFPLPSEARADVPTAFDPIVVRALAPEAGDRYADATEFREALRAALLPGASQGPLPFNAPKPAGASASPAGVEGLATLRPVLRHVDILSSLDRVLGWILLLGGVGLLPLSALTPLGHVILPFGGLAVVVLVIAGIMFLRQGKLLARMTPDSREAQVTASVLLLFFPPLFTAMGIYGLWALTNERARRAFATGRRALEGPPPVVARVVAAITRPPRKRQAFGVLRLLALVAVLWSVYVGFLVTDASSSMRHGRLDGRTIATVQDALAFSGICMAVSLAALVMTWRARHRRRGFGIALFAFVLFFTDCALLSRAPSALGLVWHRPARTWSAVPPPPGLPPGWSPLPSRPGLPSLPRLEIQK